MRVVFLGSGAFGLPTLKALATAHEVVAVVSQPDRPAGRGMKLTPTPIAEWAAAGLPGVPLYKPTDINEPATCQTLRSLNADAWVVIAFGQKLGRPLLEGVFAINLHASLLPRWRGAAPINAAILGGDTMTGNSVITLADRMDAGLVLASSGRAIEPRQTAGELHDLLSDDGPALVLDVLARKTAGTLQPVPQDEGKVTKARKLSKADGVLDFSLPAPVLRRRVHGLTPWPGVSVTVGEHTLKALRVAESKAEGPPGRLVDPATGLVSCGEGTGLVLLEVQPAGGRPMTWEAMARGAGRSLAPGASVR